MMNRRAQIAKASPRLQQSKAFQHWLNEPIFVLSDVAISRRQVAALTDTPCTTAAAVLHRTCKNFRITTLDRLHDVGLDGLLRCRGVGERTAWIAACVLYQEGYDLASWTRHTLEKGHSLRGAIRLVQHRTLKQKHG